MTVVEKVQSKVPQLRFPDYSDNYTAKTISSITERVVNPVEVEDGVCYTEIGIRSHGRGIFHKEKTTSADIRNKRVFWLEPDLFIVNIVFAWEQAVAVTSDSEIGKIASHRFPMFKAVKGEVSTEYLHRLFLTKRGKNLLELASPGGAGRNKTLGQKEFEKLKVNLPKPDEQTQVTSFLASVDKKISLLKQKHEQLVQYKKGIMQQLFSQQLRFKDDNGQNFPDWEMKTVSSIMSESRIKGNKGDVARKITVKLWGRGVFEKVDKDGSENTQYYTRKSGQFIYSKLDFLNCAFGIIPKELDGLESTVDLPCFDISEKVNRTFILEYIKQKRFYKKYGDMADGSRKAKRIHADTFLSFPVHLPSEEEQNKIADFLDSIDQKINLAQQQLEQTQTYKQGLLQQMFV